MDDKSLKISLETRKIEALLFAANSHLSRSFLEERMEFPDLFDDCMSSLSEFYRNSYIDIVTYDDGFAFRVDVDKIKIQNQTEVKTHKLDGTSLIVLSVIALHQPVTYPEICDLIGEKFSRKVLDRLVKIEMIEGMARKAGTGRAVVYVTTDEFLIAFKLHSLDDLPSVEEIMGDFKPPRMVEATPVKTKN